MLKTLRKKTHRILGLIISFGLIIFSVSGILLNHRSLISSYDIPQKAMPKQFRNKNWNNGSLKGALHCSASETLLYGSSGVWRTDSKFKQFEDYNKGFPSGLNNRKVFDLEKVGKHLYAATQAGLFVRTNHWERIEQLGKERFVGITSIGNIVYALNRSYLFIGRSKGTATSFKKIQLPAIKHDKGNVSLFETIWQLHSGEIAGIIGRLFVDTLGLVTILLSSTGIIYFFAPKWVKYRGVALISKAFKKTTAWSIRTHRKQGKLFFLFLIGVYLSGAFLRPPLLIPIARIKTPPIPFSHLDQQNPWHDQLRDLCYNPITKQLVLATKHSLYLVDRATFQLYPCKSTPPLSIMGITVLQPIGTEGAYVVGSFSGLYLWHPHHTDVLNLITMKTAKSTHRGPPVGRFNITGYLNGPGERPFFVEYGAGVMPLHHNHPFAKMPPELTKKTALWNAALEVHTARIFSPLLGPFYLLIIPLSSITAIIVCWSGYKSLSGCAKKE